MIVNCLKPHTPVDDATPIVPMASAGHAPSSDHVSCSPSYSSINPATGSPSPIITACKVTVMTQSLRHSDGGVPVYTVSGAGS